MMVRIGPYILIGLIAIIAIGIGVLITLMLRSSMQEKKLQQAEKEAPRVDTLAEQIKNQFKVEEEKDERKIYTKSGVAKTSFKQTRSAFAFQEGDAAPSLSLESNFDNGPDNTFGSETADKN